MIKKILNTKITVFVLLSCIMLLAGLIRVYQIGNVPVSPDWDEVALGYNAYSIMLTGRDEYGEFLPVVLQSFDDYKPALYAYFIIPFIPFFGLSVEAVRLPAVIFGVLGVLGVFLLVRTLFPNGISHAKVKIGVNTFSLVSAFLMAIAPWHIQFSRVAFEAQVGLVINIFAIVFFLKALDRKIFLPLSFALAAISIYVYQSEKVYIPLLFLVLFSVFYIRPAENESRRIHTSEGLIKLGKTPAFQAGEVYKEFIKIPKKWIVSSFLLAILIVLPMAMYIVANPNALNRAKGVSVFSDTTKLLSENTTKIERDRESDNYLGLLLDNRRIEYVKAFTGGYLSHFEPNWLFYRGDSLRHQAPFMGLLYLWELPFILIGLYILIFSNVPRRIKTFIICYILIAPIPASITIDVPHAVRAINMLPAPQILTSIGLLYAIFATKNLKSFLKYPLYVIVAGAVTLNIIYYLNQYFVHMNYYYSKAWQYGWQEAVSYTLEHQENFNQVIVSNVSPLDQSYMFYLFYMKYDPGKYLEAGGTKSGGFADEHTAFEKFVFRPIDWEKDRGLRSVLFVGRSDDLPDNRGKVINYLDGEPAIVFSEKHE